MNFCSEPQVENKGLEFLLLFQLQVDVAKEEILENQQQLKVLARSKESAEQLVSRSQELLHSMEASIKNLLEVVKDAEKTKGERNHALVDLLCLIQEWIQLKQKLLEDKEKKWRVERGMWGVNNNMNWLREFITSVTKTVCVLLLLFPWLSALALTQD